MHSIFFKVINPKILLVHVLNESDERMSLKFVGKMKAIASGLSADWQARETYKVLCQGFKIT